MNYHQILEKIKSHHLIIRLAKYPLIKHISLSLIVLIIFVKIVFFVLDIVTEHNDVVIVPDLSNKSMEFVAYELEKNNLNFVITDSMKYTPLSPPFSVVEQDPKAGKKVKKNRKIYLKLNSGDFRKVRIPNIIQITKRNASAKLAAMGLRVGNIIYVDNIGKNMVLGMLYKNDSLQIGDMVPETSKIDFICGNGNKAKLKKMNIDNN